MTQGNIAQFLFAGRAFRADFPETVGDHDQCTHPFLAAFIGHTRDQFSGNDDDRQINFVRDVQDRSIGFHGHHRTDIRVDRINGAGIATLQHAAQHNITDSTLIAGSADERHGFRA